MKNKSNKIVMFDSDEAASFKTNISGWVSRQGHFWGDDERAARYDGCTHTRCEDCGKPVDRGRLICQKCHNIRQIKKYNTLPKEEWDEKGMIYSNAADRYFMDWEEVDAFIENEGGKVEELRLVICEPQYLPLLDSFDYGYDSLAEDGELPDAVVQAIEDFNKVIKNVGAVSWHPVNKAVLLP